MQDQLIKHIFLNKPTMSDFNYIEYLKNNPLLQKSNNNLITESQEAPKSSKMKKSELKAKIREEILSTLGESEELNTEEVYEEEDVIEMYDSEDFENTSLGEQEEEEVEEESEEDVESDEEMSEPQPNQSAGLTDDEQEIQNSLKIAYDRASAMGDEKLANQIGNSITFFTRTHVVER